MYLKLINGVTHFGVLSPIPERLIPYSNTTSCKSIQPISLAKSQAYSHLAAAKSVVRLGTLKTFSPEKACTFSAPTCTLHLVAQAGKPQG
ncbi:hypothetical protein I6H07_17880 [Hafnia alvei]|uniref:hypothetical protein n=1 Tax=Hafnia alvei TaxID=569 RepID=UPI000FDBE53C|nr:hypothetical protein [Hafnia alvei]MBI0277645.1 hypothetical protein [Hafnia alvei]